MLRSMKVVELLFLLARKPNIPFLSEYTLNHTRDPSIIQRLFPHLGILRFLGN